jgi:RimJ/RimL family protein N-acetyltransferase
MSDRDRTRAFRRALEEATAERREPFAHGVGYFSDSIPNVYDVNYLVLDRVATTAEHAAEADALMERFHHRKVVAFEGGSSLVNGFAQHGWQHSTHLIMAHRREPDRLVDTSCVREATIEELVAAKRASTLSQTGGSDGLGEQLREADRRVAQAISLRFFAAFVGGRVAGYCELRSDGRTAQIEDVATAPEFRGRGLGRAIVQFALEEARRAHDLVFLEALEDDWPRELYAKLGFDVVDELHVFLHAGHPLTGLRLRTPRLELRLATVAELRALAALARAGVHDPAEMPFEVAWTDSANSPTFDDEFVEFHRQRLERSSPEEWRLELVAFAEGQPVGTQGLGAVRFREELEVSTGSWLGRSHQGRGLGLEQRAAVLQLAFEGLGARAAVSAAWEANGASLGVSWKLGYTEVGTKVAHPRGEPVVHRVLRLERADFTSPVPVEIEGLDALRAHLGLDDHTSPVDGAHRVT